MLLKSQRLNLKKNFKRMATGKRLETTSFKIFSKTGENSQALIGIGLSSKNFRKANKRNRAKRLTSTAIQLLYPTLPTSLNLVIMPKSLVLDKSPESLVKELKDVLGIR